MDKRDKIKARNVKIVLFSLAVVLAAGFLIMELVGGNLFSQGANGELVMLEKGTAIKYDFSNRADFYACPSSGFFYSTKDGIKYIDASGVEKMSSTYSFIAPVLVGEGSFAAVYEQSGKTVKMYSQTGLEYELSMESSILAVSINGKGYSSVITQSGSFYEIFVYTSKGFLQKRYKWDQKYSFPVSSAISADSRILALGVLEFGNVEVNSNVIFLYINPTEAMNVTDSIFASLAENRGEYIAMLKFMDKNKLLMISDRNLTLVDVENGCKKEWVMTPGNKLDDICFIGGAGFAIAVGEPIANLSPDEPGLVKIYDLNMRLSGSRVFDRVNSVKLQANFDSVLVESGGSITALSGDGKQLWHFGSDQQVNKALLVNNANTVLVSGELEARLFSLGKPKTEEIE